MNDSRNPFGVADVPDPDGDDVRAFAATVQLDGGADDPNASAWSGAAGAWSSRWNGGADPAIPGDMPALWKAGRAEVIARDDRIFILFDWNDGARRGLLEARRDGGALWLGRYLNLSDPTIARPWVGLMVGDARIDGRWTNGRLDFRR